MNTQQLPNEIQKLKEDLQKRVIQFNKESDLYIGGVIIEGIYAEEFGNNPIVKSYKIAVNIEL